MRSALLSWGRTEVALGGIALVGSLPAEAPEPVDAVIISPRGILVVAGIELPDPALRLEAPLDAQWKADGWPLVSPEHMLNPSVAKLRAATAAAALVRTVPGVPAEVRIVLAVGPYVGEVIQPPEDLPRVSRMCYPEPETLLTVARELTTAQVPCSVDTAQRIVHLLSPSGEKPSDQQLAAEGFVVARRTIIAPATAAAGPRLPSPATSAAPPIHHRIPRWAPIGAVGVLVLLLGAGILVAQSAPGGGAWDASEGARTTTFVPYPGLVVDGHAFHPEASAQGTDCAAHAFGDLRSWLSEHPCVMLRQRAFATTVDGRNAAVDIAEIRFASTQLAKAFLAASAIPGGGGITDLVKEGHHWPGAPTTFSGAAYRAKLHGRSVRITQAVWTDGPSRPGDPELYRIAEQASTLPPAR
ncbi:MAG: hypothetical protein ACRDRN_12010 [Sciscionella sp.]